MEHKGDEDVVMEGEKRMDPLREDLERGVELIDVRNAEAEAILKNIMDSGKGLSMGKKDSRCSLRPLYREN